MGSQISSDSLEARTVLRAAPVWIGAKADAHPRTAAKRARLSLAMVDCVLCRAVRFYVEVTMGKISSIFLGGAAPTHTPAGLTNNNFFCADDEVTYATVNARTTSMLCSGFGWWLVFVGF